LTSELSTALKAEKWFFQCIFYLYFSIIYLLFADNYRVEIRHK